MDIEAPALAIILIVFQVGDAIACIGPIDFIKRSLDAVDCPESIRRILPFVKIDSAIGLTIGLWVPWVGVATIGALILYFVIAIGFHVRARDTVANTIGAVVMLGVVIAVGAISYLPAL
ncbi:MAG: DoxX family protein [Actinomycetota bacterium]